MGLGVIRALGVMGVPVIAIYYNRDDMGYVSRYVSERFHFPHPELEVHHFIDELIKLASRFPDTPLFPVSDESLKVVSKHKAQLQRYFKVACAEWEIVQQLIEKNYTYTLAAEEGIPIPKTTTPKSEEDIAIFGKNLEYPCLVKPVESHRYYALFRRKIVKVYNIDQMLAAYRQAAAAGLDVILQELIPGHDSLGVNYNSYFWDGEPLLEFTAQKVRSAPPELGSPCVARSQLVPEVLESGRKLLKAMGYYGYSCSEFKLDPRDGVYKLMEVNGRHNLSTLLAVRCGLNFPWLHYRHLVEGVIPQQTAYREGLYWIDMERDLTYVPNLLFHEKESMSRIIRPYVSPHTSAVFDIRDPKPFFKRYGDFVRRLFERKKSAP
jgi:predicted ATP-grasp superfamily ATP-dependent carboligase